jgi:hypothetical protein
MTAARRSPETEYIRWDTRERILSSIHSRHQADLADTLGLLFQGGNDVADAFPIFANLFHELDKPRIVAFGS